LDGCLVQGGQSPHPTEEACHAGAELKQIRGIGDTTWERLGREHGIETIAELARLSDTEVDELQEALRASSSHVKNGDVARWREHAQQLVREREAVQDEPLATFVVEALQPIDEPGDQPRFVAHHVEGGQTLDTSELKPTIDDAVLWMRERVPMPPAPTPKTPPAERPELVHPRASDHAVAPRERPSRRGRLRITALEVHKAGQRAIDRAPRSLLAEAPVAIEDGSALVFVGHVSLEGEGPVTCQMRCRLHRIESDQEVTFTWGGEMMAAPGMQGTAISSTPVSIRSGAYQGIVFAEDRGQAARRAFCQLPILVVR
jgi:hypothetical protein